MTILRLTLVALTPFLAARGLAAQDTPITIKAGQLLDGRGSSSRNVTITVRGSKIVSVGPAAGATAYDLSGLSVMPGGIDTHVHLGWHFDPDGRIHHDTVETDAQARLYAAENAYRLLMGGLTTVQSLGGREDKDVREAIARGVLPGPRILTSLGSLNERSGTPEQIRQLVRRFKADGADVIKIFASASIRDGGGPTMTAEQVQAACGEAQAVGLRSAVHAHGPESAQRAAVAGCTVIEHGALLDDTTLALMASHGTFYDPHIGLIFQNYFDNKQRFLGTGNYTEEGFAQMERAVPRALDTFKRALARPHLRVVFGTDAVAGAHGRNFEELIYRVQKGAQTPMAAIVSATSLAAQSLNLDREIGTIALGMEADLIGLEGDPLQDITALRRVVFVMRAGVVRKNVGRRVSVNWPVYGGDAGSTKYSPLATINRDNVASLAPAWEWRPGERAIENARPGMFQVTPLAINDTLFLSTPFNRVVALDASTGLEIWSYDPGAYRYGQPSNGTGFVHRGVATWTEGQERRIFMNSRWRLIALDAATGKPIPKFGTNGEVDLAAAVLWKVNPLHYTNTSPPVVYRDLIITGNGVGDRLVYPNDPPGDIQAFDVRTGRRVWRFNPIPQRGEFGNETWEGDSWRRTGHTNVWAPFSVDVDRGLVFLPVSTPSNDFYGGDRKGNNLFAESVVCLDANTGKRVWHFQTVHHGLWDYDLPAPPSLITINVGGRRIDAVAVAAKTGFIYTFDRVSGEPVWPIEERAVAASDVPGERAARTQPLPTKPLPISRQGFTEDDLLDFTPELKALALAEMKKYRTGPIFTPPTLQGTIMMPGLLGGAGWGGTAFDAETGLLYVKTTNWPELIKLIQPPRSDTINARYSFDRFVQFGIRVPAASAGGAEGAARTAGGGGAAAATEPRRLPIHKPPYGTLLAIDMNTGEHRWQVTLGDLPWMREHPALKGLDLPQLGVNGAPGPIVTRGGLIFATGGGSTLYAVDKANGKMLWEVDLGQQGYAVPMTYQSSNGRQFVVIATGEGENAVLRAFALPENH